ncbi:MAG: RNA-binding protein [Actinomycetales bacterium]|jgi:spoIIIJ-associated protein|nr:RNA-binding protein [Candidatus Phosphoribacter baldrii]
MSEVQHDVTVDATQVNASDEVSKSNEIVELNEVVELNESRSAEIVGDDEADSAVSGVELGAGEADFETDSTTVDSDDSDGDDSDGDDDESDEAAGGGASARQGSRSRSRVALLEREGEVAADFLERLLDIADLDGDIDVDIDGDRAAVSIVDSEEGRVPRRLVGADGKVLDALQELTRLAVQTATGERSRLMLDVAGFRADRRSALVTLARESIAQVRASGVSMALADMTAFERKVVHDEVTAAGLLSESEGVEPHRHIIISPA